MSQFAFSLFVFHKNKKEPPSITLSTKLLFQHFFLNYYKNAKLQLIV